MYSDRDGSWAEIRQRPASLIPLPASIATIRDPDRIAELNDTRALRQDNIASREERHPDDPYHTIAKSPFTLAEAQSAPYAREIMLAAGGSGSTWQPLAQNVQRAFADRMPEGAGISDDRLAQFTAAATMARIGDQDPLRIDIGTDSVTIRGDHPAQVAHVDLTAPIPPAAESHAIFRQAQEAQLAALSQQTEQSVETQRGFERA